MRNGLIKLVIIQFAAYAIFGMLGFAAWIIAISNNLSAFKVIVGKYFSGHLARWTAKLPLWGILILISAIISFGAVWFLRKSRKEGDTLALSLFLLDS